MFYMSPTYLAITLFSLALTGAVSMWLRSTYAKWNTIANAAQISGAETARLILDSNGLNDVKVVSVPGNLSDHYNPATKTVNLSQANYQNASVAGMAVAAHEVGHAIQHARAYTPLAIRSALVPVANLGSRFAPMLIMLGIILRVTGLFQLGILFFAAAVLFQVVTLPVEFDASRRAAVQLNKLNLVSAQDNSGVRKVLSAAAMTYVAATLVAVMQLLYYISRSRR